MWEIEVGGNGGCCVFGVWKRVGRGDGVLLIGMNREGFGVRGRRRKIGDS